MSTSFFWKCSFRKFASLGIDFFTALAWNVSPRLVVLIALDGIIFEIMMHSSIHMPDLL